MSAITGKFVKDSEEDRWEDMTTENVQDAVNAREVLTPPNNKVREDVEEVPDRVRQAPLTKYPTAMRGGEVQVPVKVSPASG